MHLRNAWKRGLEDYPVPNGVWLNSSIKMSLSCCLINSFVVHLASVVNTALVVGMAGCGLGNAVDKSLIRPRSVNDSGPVCNPKQHSLVFVSAWVQHPSHLLRPREEQGTVIIRWILHIDQPHLI